MRYHSSQRNIVWTVLFSIFLVVTLNACGDSNNVSGPPGPAIPGPLAILTASPLPAGTTQSSYNITLAPAGGTPPYTWNLAPGSPALPNGLTLDSTTGSILGNPTATGTTSTQFRLQDSTGQSVQKSLPITITLAPGPLRILTPSLPPGTLNQPYVGTALSVTGGRSPYTWNIASGALPTGLSLDASGVISGTPVGGTSQATFRVQDSSNPQGAATKPLSISITQPTPPRITTTSLAPGTVNAAYSQTVQAAGGTGTRQWAVVGGEFPPGLNLNASNGNISGTPTDPRTFDFTLRVTDQAQLSDDQNLRIIINLPAPPSITTTSLPNATVGVPYSLQLQATGGFGALAWSITSGLLPDGLGMDGAGLISGALITTGVPAEFTVQVVDQAQRTDTRNFTLTLENSNP
jgi:Putative Ig domain